MTPKLMSGLKQENGHTPLPGIPTLKVRCLTKFVKLKKKGHLMINNRYPLPPKPKSLTAHPTVHLKMNLRLETKRGAIKKDHWTDLKPS